MNRVISIKHRQQTTNYSCGSMCFAMLTGISETQAIKECDTRKSGPLKGTYPFAIQSALNRYDIPSYHINFDENFIDKIEFLDSLSKHFPLILSGCFRDRYNEKGRDQIRHHSILIADGLVFDPGENREIDIDAYEKVFNKGLLIKSFLLIEDERPNYGRNNKGE